MIKTAVSGIALAGFGAMQCAASDAGWVFNPKGSPQGPTFVFGHDQFVMVSGSCGSSVTMLIPFKKEAMAEAVRKDVYPHLGFTIDGRSQAYPVTAFRIVEFGGPMWQVEASHLPKKLFDALTTACVVSINLIEPQEKAAPRFIASFGPLDERGRRETMAAIAEGCYRS